VSKPLDALTNEHAAGIAHPRALQRSIEILAVRLQQHHDIGLLDGAGQIGFTLESTLRVPVLRGFQSVT
jgi:hypothetical protein